MDYVDVNISSRGRDANIQLRLFSWNDGRYAGNPDNVSWNGDTIYNSNCDGCLFIDVKLSGDSLGKHHRRGGLFRN